MIGGTEKRHCKEHSAPVKAYTTPDLSWITSYYSWDSAPILNEDRKRHGRIYQRTIRPSVMSDSPKYFASLVHTFPYHARVLMIRPTTNHTLRNSVNFATRITAGISYDSLRPPS